MADTQPAPEPARNVSRADGSFRLSWAPPPPLAQHLDYAWAERSGVAEPLLPDLAVELVWSGRGLFVRGADTRAHRVGTFPDRTFVGLRFRPGAAAQVLGMGGADLADARVGISLLWGRAEMERLELRLSACASPRQAAAVLLGAVEARICGPPDAGVQALVAALQASRAPERIAELSRLVGLSERQLRRRCIAALGYGPKTLHRILRFQRFRALARDRPGYGLAQLAAHAGYADQAHLTRECVRCAGETPATHVARIRDVRFVQDRRLEASYPRGEEVWR